MAPTNAETDPDKPVKINKWDGSAVKNALDDAVRDVFTKKLKCVENFNLIDGRLLICAIAVGTALFALISDYLYPFPMSRTHLICCVGFYFFMMGVLTLYVSYIEKGIIIVTHQRDPTGFDDEIVWSVSTQLEKYSDRYTLTLVCKNKKKQSTKENQFVKSVALFFDENGTLVQENLEKEILKLHTSLSSSKKNK